MALAELAVDFKVKGADQSLRQFDRLAQSVTKLGSTVDRQSGIIRNAFSTMLGVLSGNAVTGLISAAGRGIRSIASIPSKLMDARAEISRARADLIGAGLDVYEVDMWEKAALNFKKPVDAYLKAAYEIQSSIPKASFAAKKAIVEASSIMASVSSMSQEEATKMMASLVHTFNYADKSNETIISEVKKLAGYFKGTIDVGVFRGPEMMEMLKESVPLLTQKGWDSPDIMAAATFWKTQGFRASSTGVAMREWGQRITPAAAWMKVAGDVYEKQGEAGLQRLMKNTGKFKDQYIQAQKYLFESGFSSGGMKRQAEEYMKYIERIPAWTRDHMRKRGEHEALQPYVNSMMAGYKKLMEMYKDIAGSTYDSMLDKAGELEKELIKVTNTYNQVKTNLQTELGRTYEPMWIQGLKFMTNELEGVRVWITENMPLLRTAISSFGRGLWDSLKGIDADTPVGRVLAQIKELADAFSNKGQISMAMEGWNKGGEFGRRIVSMFDGVWKSSPLSSINAKMDAASSALNNASDKLGVIAKALEAIAAKFGYETPEQQVEREKEEKYNTWEKQQNDTEEMEWVTRHREFWGNLWDGIKTAIESVSVRPEDIRAAIKESQATIPDSLRMSGTLNITGNTATLNGSGKLGADNKVNAATGK